jgi:hypothetical protein
MKNTLLLLLSFCLTGFACKKTVPKVDSTCLNQKMEAFKTSEHAVSILRIVSKGELVYKFRTEPSCGDGEVYNEKCEVVCPGGKRPELPSYNCPTAEYSEWELIWEK